MTETGQDEIVAGIFAKVEQVRVFSKFLFWQTE